MVMTINDHGGLCCGVKHLHGFGFEPGSADSHEDEGGNRVVRETKIQALDRLLDDWDLSEAGHGPGNQRILEVILTDRQTTNWHPHLLERGFRKVYRFYNSNSRNHCNYYAKHDRGLEVFDGVPAAPQPEIQAPTPVVNRPFAVGDRVRYIGNLWPARAGAEGTIREIRDIESPIGIMFDDLRHRGLLNPDAPVFASRASVQHVEPEVQAEGPVAAAPANTVSRNLFVTTRNERDQLREELRVALADVTEARRSTSLRVEELRVTRATLILLQQQNQQLIHRNESQDTTIRTLTAQLATARTELQQVERRVAAPPERAVIFSDYFVDLQLTGRKGPFSTVEAARQRYPRARNIQRRAIYNDGAVEISPHR